MIIVLLPPLELLPTSSFSPFRPVVICSLLIKSLFSLYTNIFSDPLLLIFHEVTNMCVSVYVCLCGRVYVWPRVLSNELLNDPFSNNQNQTCVPRYHNHRPSNNISFTSCVFEATVQYRRRQKTYFLLKCK